MKYYPIQLVLDSQVKEFYKVLKTTVYETSLKAVIFN